MTGNWDCLRSHCINTSRRKWPFLTHPPCYTWPIFPRPTLAWSGIHGELPRCSEGKTNKDPNILNSGFRSTQTGEQICFAELLLLSETSTTSLTIKFSVGISSVVFTLCQQQM